MDEGHWATLEWLAGKTHRTVERWTVPHVERIGHLLLVGYAETKSGYEGGRTSRHYITRLGRLVLEKRWKMLLAQILMKAGVKFIDAKCHHTSDGMKDIKIVVAAEEDLAAAKAWAAREGHTIEARVASTQELAEHKALEEML